jgi:hypothetical protein
MWSAGLSGPSFAALPFIPPAPSGQLLWTLGNANPNVAMQTTSFPTKMNF